MSLNLKSSGGGSVTVDVPSTASNYTATLPAGTGNVVVNGINGALVSGTSVTASGTSVDFTSIPSWVKRITVMFFDVSSNGSDYILMQIGTSGGMATDTNYFSMTGANTTSGTASAVNFTTGFGVQSGSASNSLQGQFVLTNITGNTWIASGIFTGNTSSITYSTGRRTLGDTLTQLRITTTGGTNTFDAGSINILYE